MKKIAIFSFWPWYFLKINKNDALDFEYFPDWCLHFQWKSFGVKGKKGKWISNPMQRFGLFYRSHLLKFISKIVFLFWRCTSNLGSFHFPLNIFFRKRIANFIDWLHLWFIWNYSCFCLNWLFRPKHRILGGVKIGRAFLVYTATIKRLNEIKLNQT